MLTLEFRGGAGRKLKRVLENGAKLGKMYGSLAQDLKDRISELRSVSSLADYQDSTLGRRVRFHALTGGLAGSYSITVKNGYAIRIVVTPTTVQADLSVVTKVYVEVTDHYKK